jgi:hypothetical protein
MRSTGLYNPEVLAAEEEATELLDLAELLVSDGDRQADELTGYCFP